MNGWSAREAAQRKPPIVSNGHSEIEYNPVWQLAVWWYRRSLHFLNAIEFL
jgi:hypothetical protein